MSFIKKLQANKRIKDMVIADAESKTVEEFYHAGSVTLNILLSGKVNGGFPKGKVTALAAPKSHFKTIVATIGASSAQKKGATVLWIDSEFAFSPSTAKMFGMDISEDKFVLVQDNSLENIKGFIVNAFESYNKKEDGPIFMVVDSLGTMITSKTLDDALAMDDKKDMSVASKKNDLSKLILRMSGIHDVTVVLIAHVYEDMKQYSTGAISGGSGLQYVASNILKITSKAKEKDEDGLIGGNVFIANTEKGRMARENTKLKFKASYDDGINSFYGILDDALEGGYVQKPSVGWYVRPHIEDDKKFRESQIYNADFWKPIFKDTDFKKYLETKYSYEDHFSAESKVYDLNMGID